MSRHPEVPLLWIREEEIHDDPRIVLFHDVISDHEISRLKELGIPQIRRAKVGGLKNGTETTARIGKM